MNLASSVDGEVSGSGTVADLCTAGRIGNAWTCERGACVEEGVYCV